ncbi:glycosyltransferase [Candidatus Viadribacter manganicus]|uniref:Glycosyltransferase n=1 Tax=Candidatus Viadribacter manganicus TaxID=1759059 RepID=A0A1B1AJX7_9PROT|nr:glycosyltransferase [Candidatus Viadribacter manganicus]ANP46857.1 glycosyltransferase [Candidatus Viadribacter manganicus]
MSLLQTLGSPVNGGAETYFVSLTGAFARAGIAQAAAIRAHAGREHELKSLGVATRVLPFSRPFDFTTPNAISSLAREHDARIVIAWMNRAASLTPAGPWKRIGRLGGYYKLKNYRGYDALVGNTQDIVDWIVSEGWPKERAHYVPNFAGKGGGEKIDRVTLNTPADAPLLLGMGRLHTSKAHDVSLRALKHLPDAYLWIAGDGPDEAVLKSEAVDLGVGDRVRFLGWRDDAPALYRTADVCVFPSRFEPLGNVVIQSWAHGLPVIAARSAGPGALIRDGEDGFLIDIDDAEGLAMKTRALLADKELSARFVANGAKRVETEFSEAAVVAQWRSLFDAMGGL